MTALRKATFRKSGLANSARNDTGKFLSALVADAAGKIFEIEGYAASHMSLRHRTPILAHQSIPLPSGSELMLLPDRAPVLYNIQSGSWERIEENPYRSGEPIYPVAVFNSPGYLVTGISAYAERPGAEPLSLFSYGAAGWHRGRFRSSALQVDAERRQDLRLMPADKIAAGVRAMGRSMPDNRLRAHLETCALQYGCPAAKNFFLGRCEAPLPTARRCNASCLGCLSLQPEGSGIHPSQNRIAFTPTPDEIAEVALAHLLRVRRGVVSFGQGCEGDPLTAEKVIEPAIRRIRSLTRRGTINLNTNGSLPETLRRLFDAGLDSVRISFNSAREPCYRAYFRPRGYRFADVLESVRLALQNKVFVSINYLNLPGFTDTPEEFDALTRLLERHPVDMIQWRNLNFDPLRYWQLMAQAAPLGDPLGMDRLLEALRRHFPQLRHGYFNPPRETFRTNVSGAVAQD